MTETSAWTVWTPAAFRAHAATASLRPTVSSHEADWRVALKVLPLPQTAAPATLVHGRGSIPAPHTSQQTITLGQWLEDAGIDVKGLSYDIR